MSTRAPRTQSRSATVTVATAVEPANPEQVLRFDFDGQRAPANASGPNPSPRVKDASIKDAIIRWLNEQL